MIHVVLVEPQVSNTGNIIRLCANTGATLHLVEPLGFELEAKKLRRAGLDYEMNGQKCQSICQLAGCSGQSKSKWGAKNRCLDHQKTASLYMMKILRNWQISLW
ncbi:MAG: TrmH family RNA methyltransferase [Moraxella sp.]